MDIRVLRYFLAVAREENITRAAESLHIAQPSLSKQLMELENEIGKSLLIRGKRKITLTEEGILLRKRADEIVSLLEKTQQELSSDMQEISGEISIGGNTAGTVLKAAAALRQVHPGVQFHFYCGDATDVTERLDHGLLDFSVMLEPADTVKYDFLLLPDSSGWGMLLQSSDPLAKKSVITPEDFHKLPLILHQRIGLQQEIAHWAQADLEQLNIVATYNVVHGSPITFTSHELGYFITTRDLLAPVLDPSVCFRPLDPPLSIRYVLVWKKHPAFGKAADAFLKQVRQIVCADSGQM